MKERPIVIRGGASEYHAAAVAAVVQHVLDTESQLRGIRPPAHVPHAWVRIGRHAPIGRFSPPVVPDPGVNWRRG